MSISLTLLLTAMVQHKPLQVSGPVFYMTLVYILLFTVLYDASYQHTGTCTMHNYYTLCRF